MCGEREDKMEPRIQSFVLRLFSPCPRLPLQSAKLVAVVVGAGQVGPQLGVLWFPFWTEKSRWGGDWAVVSTAKLELLIF